MSEENVTFPAGWRDCVDHYVDGVELALLEAGAPRGERRSIVEMVEAQVHEMLRDQLSTEATLDDVKRLLDQLDPPDRYAAEFSSSTTVRGRRTPSRQLRRCKWSLIALIAMSSPPISYALAFVLPLEVSAWLLSASGFVWLFGTPVFAMIALRRIARSRIRLVGRTMALTVLFAYILLLANALTYFLVATVFGDFIIILSALISLATLNAGLVLLLLRATKQFFPTHFPLLPNGPPVSQNGLTMSAST